MTRVFFAILKEISIENKNGDISKSLHPTSLSDGTYVCYDEIEFLLGVLVIVRSLLQEKKDNKKWYQRKAYTDKDVLGVIRTAMLRKTRELREMTIRVP